MGPLDPSQIRLVATLGRCSSFVKVADRLNVHQSTITRQISKIEDLLGFAIVTRSTTGYTLTDVGRQLVTAAQSFEAAYDEFHEKLKSFDADLKRSIRVRVPEGLGTYWILPRFIERGLTNDIHIDFVVSNDLHQSGGFAEDLSVQFTPAQRPDDVQISLGHLHVMPFASRGYLAKHGAPRSKFELGEHRLISQLGPHGLADLWMSIEPTDLQEQVKRAIVLSTNSGGSHYAAVSDGLGIGNLPTHV